MTRKNLTPAAPNAAPNDAASASARCTVEAGSYLTLRSARLMMRYLCEKSIPCRLAIDGKKYSVRAGRFECESAARDYLVLFLSLGIKGAKVVPEKQNDKKEGCI